MIPMRRRATFAATALARTGSFPRTCSICRGRLSSRFHAITGRAAADPPCLWDTVSGTDWQTIDGGWSLLTDRLGIMVTAESPEEWQIGKPPPGAGGPWPVPDGKLRGIKGIANPNTDPAAPVGEQQFYLRLTTVIEGDFGIDAEAYRRDASPMKQTIIRRVDAKDHFHYDVVDGTSAFSKTPLSRNVVQDDTDRATAHACQLRSAHEFPPLSASITIPMVVTSYQVGDRISQIAGREVSFQINAGAEQQEAPSYPFVVAVTWDFTGEKQSTILQLTDRAPSRVGRSQWSVVRCSRLD